MATPHKTLITATSRSGTTFTTCVLKGLGLSATHESVYPLNGKAGKWPDQDHIEVSWGGPLHMPWPEDLFVIHLIRRPMDVITSLHGGLIRTNKRTNYSRVWERVAKPEQEYNDIDYAAWHYLTWHDKIVERRDAWARLDSDHFYSLIGHFPKRRIRRAQDGCQGRRNQARSPDTRPVLQIHDLRPEFAGRVSALTDLYGYRQ